MNASKALALTGLTLVIVGTGHLYPDLVAWHTAALVGMAFGVILSP